MIFKDSSSQCISICPMNNKNGVNYKAEALSKFYKASINYSRERSCVCGKHCGLPGLPG